MVGDIPTCCQRPRRPVSLQTCPKPIRICSCAIVLFSCGDNSNEANAQYEKARKLFENGQYANAKNAIDSIELLYPKAFKQIKAGMLLMCRVKQKESEQNLLI